MQDPSAYVISDRVSSLLTAQSATPTISGALSATPPPSRPIDGRLHIFQPVFQPCQALRVADHQVSFRLEHRSQPYHHLALSGLVEIDHYVPAEDRLEAR